MAIQVYLSEVLKDRNMTSKELSALVDITEANLSILRSGKAKGVGDLLKFDGNLEDDE